MAYISKTDELSLNLADSKLERLSNILDISTSDNELSQDDSNVLDYLKYVNKNNDKLLQLNPNDLFIAFYYSFSRFEVGEKTPLSFSELQRNKDLFHFTDMTFFDIADVLQNILRVAKENNISKEFINIPYKNSPLNDSQQYFFERVTETGFLDKLKEYHKILRLFCPKEEARSFFTLLLTRNVVAAIRALNIVTVLQSYRNTEGENISFELDIEKPLVAVKRIIKEYISKFEELIKEKDDKKREKTREKEIVDECKDRLYLEEPAIIFEKELALLNSDVANILLESILWHNRDKYIDIIEASHGNGNITRLKEIFSESCFSFESLSSEQANTLIEHIDLACIERMLKSFKDLEGYNDSFPIYDILMLSNEEIVTKINKLIQEKKVSISFVLNNPSIFVERIPEELEKLTEIKEATHSYFINNIEALKENSINTYQVSTSKDSAILLMDNQEMKKRLQLINSYKLQYNNSSDYSLFFNPSLIKIADAFIELGLGEFIRNKPSYICESSKTAIERIRICRAHRMAFEKYNEIERIIKTPQFAIDGNLISDEDLRFFIPNAIPLYANANALMEIEKAPTRAVVDKDIKELLEFQKSQLVYKINGITISRQKVLRNLSVLEESESCKDLPRNVLLFNAIVCGSVFDNNQLSILSNSIEQINEKLEK